MRYSTNLSNVIVYTEPSGLSDNFDEKISIRDKFVGKFLKLVNSYGIIPDRKYEFGYEWTFEFKGVKFEIHEDKSSDDADVFYLKYEGVVQGIKFESAYNDFNMQFKEFTMDKSLEIIKYCIDRIIIQDFRLKNHKHELERGGSYKFHMNENISEHF